MSDVIKLNGKSSNSTVKLASFRSTSVQEDEHDVFKRQLEEYYRMGFREGQEKIRREIEQNYMDKLSKKYEEVYNVLHGYDENLEVYEKAFEGLVIETAFELAKKIVQREVESQSIINENVKTAINKIIGANEVRLKFHPKDLDELTEASKNIIHSSSFNKIKIEADERIEQGGCLIETEIGNVDARISTQLNELKKQLHDSLVKKG